MIETDKKLLLGTTDIIFKSLLLDKDNPDYLKGLITEITGIPLSKLDNMVIKNNEYTVNNIKDKRMRSDIIVSVDNMHINIEMNPRLWKGLFNRNDNYVQGIASNFYDVSEDYLSEYKIIQINLNCFNYLRNNKEVSKLVYKEYDTNELDPNYEYSIKYHVDLELIKNNCYNKKVESLTKLQRYCLLLTTDSLALSKYIAGDDKVMKKVSEKLDNLSSDEKIMGLYDAEIEAAKIQRTMIKGAKQEGAEEEKNEIAKKMLAEGLDINIISKIIGYSIEQINDLK